MIMNQDSTYCFLNLFSPIFLKDAVQKFLYLGMFWISAQVEFLFPISNVSINIGVNNKFIFT